MNIKEILTRKSDKLYAGSFRRGSAAAIDAFIVLLLRILVAQILGKLWIEPIMVKFLADFQAKFGTATPKGTAEHMDFIAHHYFFINLIAFYLLILLVGAFYHAYLNSSLWQGTVGKRLMKIVIVKEIDKIQSKISLKLGFLHYILSILPFIFILYLIAYQIRTGLDFYQIITASEINVFFGIIFVLWVQIHLFTKRKITAYDMICHTILINHQTSAKLPWSKRS